jgi:antitoxin component YwqK of YwqJK toxin-antitoxin module
MKKENLFLTLLFLTYLLNGQNLIKGQIVDQYGEEFIADVSINNKEIEVDFETGKFEFETFENKIEIDIKFQFYLSIRYQLEFNNKFTDLGKIYLISDSFWFDGPKNGIITGNYKSGKPKYRIEIKKWDSHGKTEFYNKEGILTQKIIYKNGKPKNIFIRKDGVMQELKFEFNKKEKLLTVPNNGYKK